MTHLEQRYAYRYDERHGKGWSTATFNAPIDKEIKWLYFDSFIQSLRSEVKLPTFTIRPTRIHLPDPLLRNYNWDVEINGAAIDPLSLFTVYCTSERTHFCHRFRLRK